MQNEKNLSNDKRQYETWERFIDYEVQDQTNEKIGTVHSLWIDEDSQPTFLGVKTGWFSGKNHVVPISSATVNHHQQTVRLPFSEEKIKDAPSFDADCELTDADEKRICGYYGTQGAKPPSAEKKQQQPGSREQANIQLSEEHLKIGKREVAAGGVRLRKVVRTETVNQPVELNREEVVIERVPASGAQQPGQTAFQGRDVFIPLRREEAVVQKEARVREEVHARKDSTSERQTISEKVRKEDVEIEKEGDARYATDTGKPRTGAQRYEAKERSKP